MALARRSLHTAAKAGMAGEGSVQAEPWTLPHMVATVRPWFDAAMYAREYRDVTGSADELLVHFCERGWKEGRNPNADFDTLAYLRTNLDVLQHGLNPIYHYIYKGQSEARATSPAALPSRAALNVLGTDPGDWVALVRPHVDPDFYAAALGPAAAEGVDLAAHFAYRGWLDGLDPNRDFHTREALTANPDLLRKQFNPLVHALATAAPPKPVPAPEPAPTAAPAPAGTDEPVETPRFGPKAFGDSVERMAGLRLALEEARVSSLPDPGAYGDEAEAAIAREFDAAFYRTMNTDVIAARMDLVTHFGRHGWHEGRNPAPWFDVRHYLAAYPDVAATGMNPFLHYIRDGRAEGRQPKGEPDWRRVAIAAAAEPVAPPPPVLTGDGLGRSFLEAALGAVCGPGKGLAILIGRDSPVAGGLAAIDERADFASRGMAVLEVAPVDPSPLLAGPDGGLAVNLVLNGTALGPARCDDLAAALGGIPPAAREGRAFVIHDLLGHGVEQLIRLQAASASTDNLFWIHDYSSVCPGFRLLRNDATYCGAPPVDSVACRVCVYGAARPWHVAEVMRLFAAVPFTVAAPSQTALDVWQRGAIGPVTAVQVRPPVAAASATKAAGTAARGTPDDPVRVAFIGPAGVANGGPVWSALTDRVAGLAAYSFVTMGSAEGGPAVPGLPHILLPSNDGEAVARAVADHGIDLVLAASPWPETCAATSLGAIAGGADVVCLRDSGDVAAAVRSQRSGIVAVDQPALLAFFETLAAVDYVRRRAADAA